MASIYLNWTNWDPKMRCSAVLPFYIVLVSYAREMFDRKFSFSVFLLQEKNIMRALSTSELPNSWCNIGLANPKTNWVCTAILSIFTSENFSWRAINTKLSANCRENLCFLTISWILRSKTRVFLWKFLFKYLQKVLVSILICQLFVCVFSGKVFAKKTGKTCFSFSFLSFGALPSHGRKIVYLCC